MSISILKPVLPDNSIVTQRIPNSQFLHTKCAMLKLMRLNLSPKVHILFVHMTTKVEVYFIAKNDVQEIKMFFDSLTDDLPEDTSLNLTCIGVML